MSKAAKSLVQTTADKIYNMIIKEHIFNPGDKLPNENELSEQLGISRATLRESVKVLSMQGILNVMRGKGTYVATDIEVFNDYGLGNFDKIKIRLKDLYEMRLLFEPQVAAIACRRASDEEIREICKCGEEVAKSINENSDRTEADQKFHQLIVSASHNDFLTSFVPLIHRAVDESILYGINSELLSEYTLKDHALIMEFLSKRDELGTKNAMEIHMHHAIDILGLNNGNDPLY